jgi:hypothetical protein
MNLFYSFELLDLKPGGRMAVSDIISERQLTEKIVCNSSLRAACIGGASQINYCKSIITEIL